jgi:hypothetical protein
MEVAALRFDADAEQAIMKIKLLIQHRLLEA